MLVTCYIQNLRKSSPSSENPPKRKKTKKTIIKGNIEQGDKLSFKIVFYELEKCLKSICLQIKAYNLAI